MARGYVFLLPYYYILRESDSPPVKSFLRLWNKNVQMEIFMNIQKFALQVVRKCSSRGSANGAVQTLILTPN